MTTAWPQRKSMSGRNALGPVAALTAVLGAAALTGPICAATTERLVVERYTGLAISGYDPVAYFTDGRAVPGKDEFEQALAGAVWRFHNAGNMAAFAADPEVYAPRFGGYDPLDIARGVAVPGNPELWLIRGKRLYFFYTAAARDAFAADSGRTLATADRAWPPIARALVE
jgi:hypothetical protein